MTAVWLAQCLCPQRHTIMAAAGEADEDDAEAEILEPLKLQVATALTDGLINPWCQLCKAVASDWTCEVGRTRFRTMAEATPVLRQCEAEQLATQAFLEVPPGSRH
jgi:hypothetical protein